MFKKIYPIVTWLSLPAQRPLSEPMRANFMEIVMRPMEEVWPFGWDAIEGRFMFCVILSLMLSVFISVLHNLQS